MMIRFLAAMVTMTRVASNARPLIAAFNIAALGAVFLFDAVTPADNVSICFAYTIPIVLSMLEGGGRRTVAYTGAALVLSVAGSFIQPPNDQLTVVFVANRLIAAVTLCMMALLVRYRLAMEAALQATLAQKREQIDRQRRFIVMLSHEVRTPLTVLDGHAYRLMKRGDALSTEEVAKRALKIRAAAARIEGVIGSVLTMSAVGTERVTTNPRPVNLQTLLHGLAQHTDEGETTIRCDLDRLPERIMADPLLLAQIFENLLSNAVKYSPPGAVVAISGETEGDAAVVQISDQGDGIDPRELPQVFTPYFRGANSRGVPGAGIGLHLVERFVTAHGGAVSINSRPGEGAAVTVRLPIFPPERAA
jgi:signal transduction histidine kinase